MLTQTVSESPPPLPARVWTDRTWRVFELVLVCFIAFAASIVVSGQILFTGRTPPRGTGPMPWLYLMIHEVSSLAVLWYVLRRRSRTFRDLGLRATPREFVFAPLLWIGAVAAYYLSYAAINAFLSVSTWRLPRTPDVGALLFYGGVPFTALLLQFLNPFFEELVVRAYVITELKVLTNSVPLAVAASTLLQTGYHFYQGIPLALSELWGFLLFSLYYARTGRIVAPILAHLAMDIIATVYYFGKLGPSS